MKPRGLTVVDRAGQRVGKLVVFCRADNKYEKDAVRACWLCLCDCGGKIVVTGQNLSRGLSGKGGTRSCGCLMGKTTKHGMVGTSVYRIWHMMLQRCTNPRNSAYSSYGGRGITVCDEWRDFKNFYADMGDRPKDKTLDRINNNLGYNKENCRWATKQQQVNNRRSNRYLTFNGITKTTSEWAKITDIPSHTIRARLNSGWTLEKSLTTPSKKYNFQRSI